MKKNKEEIEKSDIFRAFEYQDKFTKSGKDIKNQINSVVLPRLNSELTTYSEKANRLLEECGAMPKREISTYWSVDRKIQVPYKTFDWCETCFYEKNVHGNFETLSVDEDVPNCTAPASEYEANKRREYNGTVEMICNIMTDIKACEILLSNMEDGKTYSLNMSQLLALDF